MLRSFLTDVLDLRNGYTDFVLHEPAPTEVIERWMQNRGPGPDVDKLRFDINGGVKSDWNKELFKLLRIKFEDSLQGLDNPPIRTSMYWEEEIRKRYETLASTWRAAQAKRKADGALETPLEVEQRMMEKNYGRMKVSRHEAKRLDVSNFRSAIGCSLKFLAEV